MAGAFSALAITLLALNGCATKLGQIPDVNSGVVRSRIDSLHGDIENVYQNGETKHTEFEVENYIDVTWKTGYVASTARGLTFMPIGGPDYTPTQGFSCFAGAKFLSLGSFGLHFGVDGNCLIPLGMNYRKMGMIFGIGAAIPFRPLFEGKNPEVLPSGMIGLPF